ncbi:MAG TPA: hypothetical protein VHG28_01705 [Longimicrobiaceae bacterium]|nr:hypothetical protein [Longimicrobiaceae bacterium]
MPDTLPPELRRTVEDHLDPDTEEWWIRDLASSYPWADAGGIYWIVDVDGRSALVVEDREGRFRRLDGSPGLPALSEFVARGREAAPESFTPRGLAELLAQWHLDPRVQLLDSEFFRVQEPVLDSWIVDGGPGVEVLRSLGAEPRLVRKDGSWVLTCHVVNPQGGVEKCVVRGTFEPFAVLSFDVQALKEDGTFFYPDEF